MYSAYRYSYTADGEWFWRPLGKVSAAEVNAAFEKAAKVFKCPRGLLAIQPAPKVH